MANKGKNLTVEPVRDLQDIRAISKLLQNNKRDLLLWTIGINSGLRASDIVKLKAGQVRNLKAGEHLTIKEQKTGKLNVLAINKTTYKALNDYLNESCLENDDYLFKRKQTYNIKNSGPVNPRMNKCNKFKRQIWQSYA